MIQLLCNAKWEGKCVGFCGPRLFMLGPLSCTPKRSIVERERGAKITNSCMVIGSADQLPEVDLWVVLVARSATPTGSGGGQTNPYIGSLFDDCNLASKEPMYMSFPPNHG